MRMSMTEGDWIFDYDNNLDNQHITLQKNSKH